jgi:hypothetical protein
MKTGFALYALRGAELGNLLELSANALAVFV